MSRLLTSNGNLSLPYRMSLINRHKFICFTGTSGDAKRLDLDAVGTVKDVSIYEYDIDLGTDEKPWRKPG